MSETAGSIMAKMMNEEDPEARAKLERSFLQQSKKQLGGEFVVDIKLDSPTMIESTDDEGK